MKYHKVGNQIFSGRGKLVATLDSDGNPIMAQGMAGPHEKAVREFLSGNLNGSDAPVAELIPEVVGTEPEILPEPKPDVSGTESEILPDPTLCTLFIGSIPAGNISHPNDPSISLPAEIADIPEEFLPPFKKELGIHTPGFAEFCRKHSMTAEQTVALVRRMEQR